MKRVILVRHGKAEEIEPGISDYERSLTTKGKVVSRQMAVKLKEKVTNPGVFISSPAFRALETALIFAGEYGISPEKIKLSSELYFKVDEKNIPDVLNLAGNDTESVILFGHNPNFTDLACYFCKDSCDVIPKSGIISLTFDVKSWSDIKPGTGEAELVYKPKKIL